MMRLQRGFVLLTTLLMIEVLTVLVLALMQSVYLDFKMSNQLQANHQAFIQLESIAKQMTRNISAHVSQNCKRQALDPSQIEIDLIQKWGCEIRDNNQTYYYLFSDLGLYSCLKIVSK